MTTIAQRQKERNGNTLLEDYYAVHEELYHLKADRDELRCM